MRKVSAILLLRYALALMAMIAALAPVYWMMTISLKTEIDQFSVPPKWILFEPTLAHYTDAFAARSFGQYLLTSVVVSALSTVCAMLLGTLAAYALAQFRLPRRLDKHFALWIL